MLTLTEFAGQAYSICRAGNLALVVDADDQWRTAIAEQQLWARWSRNALQAIMPYVKEDAGEYKLELNPSIPITTLQTQKNWAEAPGNP